MRMLARSIVVAIFVIFLPCSKAVALDWVSLHEHANQISLKKALKASQENPQSLDDLYALGLVYLKQYNTNEAEKVFRKMLDIDLSTIEAQWGVAECLRRRGQYEICMRILNEIIASNPRFAPAYVSLAYIKYMQTEFNEAAGLSYRVIKLGKDNVDLTNLVRAYGLFAGAKGMIAHYGGPISKIINGRVVKPYFKKAEKLQPNSAAALYGMGSYYLLIPPVLGRNPDKALEYLEKAIEVDPLFAEVYVRIAQAYQAKGDQEKYDFYLNKALKLDPDNFLALDIKSGTCNFICIE